ncbi:GntR family transcriptional regulator [Roseibacterium sp. SDUM158016]|jgi:DNA-binding GntR family transcriptional regulator|uniref:GntR family transcriptional regulator n=1 Tax=Roseicyclus sediminis TaxID=2980997 RepID=UPI0021CDF070|nr:GntR family transcriptional regulator [Roseibacterium sp. SDUM158016]MCU4651819.1 GntR family transcriptional regulator [Roseibacterium sp. SDUM158016]
MSTSLETDLENDIIFGFYAPGMRITEDSVMEHYGVKRHAVRTAFAHLEARGLLVHRPNRGVEVVEFTPDEVDALYDVRIVLESAAAERTPLPVAPEIIRNLEDIATRHAEAVEREDFREVFWLNQEFHELQFSCCDNPRLAGLIATHARMAQPIRVVKYDDRSHMATVVAQHRAIIDAMRGDDQYAYVKATREHLPASAEAYRNLHARRFGGLRAAG